MIDRAGRTLLRALLLVAGSGFGAGGSASALDRFEIQVYDAEANPPGRASLELHLNFTPSGKGSAGYPGEVPPDRVAHMTLEPALGVTRWLELGAYLQFMLAPGGDARFGGTKLRAKLTLPDDVREALGLPVFLALNAEVGKVPVAVEQEGWANEFRPIVGVRSGRWLVSLNPILGYPLSGPDRFRVEVEPCGKVSWNTQRGFAVGAEYYASLGAIADGFLPLREQEHLLLAVVDLEEPVRPAEEAADRRDSPWELNLGVGAGLTRGTPQHVFLKAIAGRSF
ncbi:MAG TPA: hypothetical protein VIV57_04560 [Anaeromyxobacter sp.]